MTKPTDEQLTETLGVRVTKADLDRIDTLAERFPIGTRHAIARAALRIGLDAIEANPMVLLGAASPKPKRAKR